jgi:hypothetical protein
MLAALHSIARLELMVLTRAGALDMQLASTCFDGRHTCMSCVD